MKEAKPRLYALAVIGIIAVSGFGGYVVATEVQGQARCQQLAQIATAQTRANGGNGSGLGGLWLQQCDPPGWAIAQPRPKPPSAP